MTAGITYRHYILKDHLGSWTTITDAEGNVEQELSYDAWGNLRDPETWYNHTQADPVEAPMFDRGYTGHEHMTAFGLINMNGRCYDPMMSSFLSVDACLQDPTSAQGFNRYAYCAYNPLRYTDPTGWYMGPTDDNEGDGDGSNSGNSSAGIVIDPDSYTDYGDGWYSVGYSNGGVGGVYCWNNWKSTFSDVPSTHGQGTAYSDPSYYYPTISHSNGNGGHGTGGNIGGGNNQSSRTLNVNGNKPESNIHSTSSSIASAAVPVALTCAVVDGPVPAGDLVGLTAAATLLTASGLVWIGEELLDLYENLNGKNEQHGDNGRAIGKSESQIGELENQLKNAKSKKEKEKINRKIANIKKTAQKKKKGENHSNGNKR